MSFWFGDFELDQERRQLLRSGEPVPLEPKAYELLSLLLERRPRALSRAQIRDVVWPGTYVSESTLAVVVNAIRQALRDDARQPRFIRTVHGFGYAFCGEARSSGDSRPASGKATPEVGTTTPRTKGSAAASSPKEQADRETKPAGRIAAGATKRWRWVVAAAAALAALSAGTYWLGIHATTETPELTSVPLTSLPGAELDPALSPDGRLVAFSWDGPGRDNFDVYVENSASGEMSRVTSDLAADRHPVWSPDGRRLAFLRLRGTGADVFLVPASGGEERRLAKVSGVNRRFPHLQEVWPLDWSPDGRFLAVSDRGEEGRSWGISLISTETGERRVLTTTGNPRIIDAFPAFSPDGGALAFMRGSFAPDCDLVVQTLSSDMTPTAPVRTLAERVRTTLSWMPEGEGLLLADRIVLLNGSSPRPFRFPGGELDPAQDHGADLQVSVRGRRLVYSTPEPQEEMLRISLVENPHEPPVAFFRSTRGEWHPAIAPDARRVAFCSYRSRDCCIWVCNVDGSGCRELPLPRGTFYACSPSWSSDGRRLAFDAAGGDLPFHVYVVAPEGGATRCLSSARTFDARPRWSRDDRSIYLTSTRSGDFQIWKTPIDASNGDAAVRITRNGGIEAEESPDGRYLYYAKRDTPGVWRLALAEPGPALEERLLDIGGEGRWCLESQGIFVLDDDAERPPAIRFFDFATRRTSELRALPPEWDFIDTGGAFAVSPDGRWAVVAIERIAESDLMLVEGFR